jgi:hypothetical protein
MNEEMQKVRDSALRDAADVVMRARMGEIDGDFRCIIHRIESMIGKPEAPADDS